MLHLFKSKCDSFLYNRWAGLFTRYSVKYIYGIKINIFGSEHLETERPFIIVCNHQSSVDNVGEYIPMIEILDNNF